MKTTAPKLQGFRVYFDNCGDEPHFSPVEVEDCNECNPWTADDDVEIAEWQAYVETVRMEGTFPKTMVD